MNGKRLTALANAGVEDRVLDMLVALSYPEAFAIKPSPTMMGELAIGGGGAAERCSWSASPFLLGGSIFDACNPYYDGPVALRVGRLFALRVLRVPVRRSSLRLLRRRLVRGGRRRRDHRRPDRAAVLVTGARPGRERQGLRVRRFGGIERERQLGRRLVVRIVGVVRRSSGGSSGGALAVPSCRRRADLTPAVFACV